MQIYAELAHIRIDFGRIMQVAGNEWRCAIVFHIRHWGISVIFEELRK